MSRQKFSDLPIGARFSYLDETEGRVWVKTEWRGKEGGIIHQYAGELGHGHLSVCHHDETCPDIVEFIS